MFHARPTYKWIGICCTAFFVLTGIASVLAAALNIDGSFDQPLVTAIGFGVFWSLFSLLGIYLWVLAYKYQLRMTTTGVEQQGVFTRGQVDFDQVRSAHWRNWPGVGSVKLESPLATFSVDLSLLSAQEREAAVLLINAMLPASVQSGWDKFNWNPAASVQRKSIAPKWQPYIFYFLAATFVGAWLLGLGNANLFGAIFNSAFASYVLLKRTNAA